MLDALLKRGKELGIRQRTQLNARTDDVDKLSALHFAAQHGSAALVERLLCAGADPGVRCAEDLLPAAYANGRAVSNELEDPTERARGALDRCRAQDAAVNDAGHSVSKQYNAETLQALHEALRAAAARVELLREDRDRLDRRERAMRISLRDAQAEIQDARSKRQSFLHSLDIHPDELTEEQTGQLAVRVEQAGLVLRAVREYVDALGEVCALRDLLAGVLEFAHLLRSVASSQGGGQQRRPAVSKTKIGNKTARLAALIAQVLDALDRDACGAAGGGGAGQGVPLARRTQVVVDGLLASEAERTARGGGGSGRRHVAADARVLTVLPKLAEMVQTSDLANPWGASATTKQLAAQCVSASALVLAVLEEAASAESFSRSGRSCGFCR